MHNPALENVFKHDYQTDSWKDILTKIFPNATFYKVPVEEELIESRAEDAKHIYQYGNVELADGKTIYFYEVELHDGKSVTRNRVGLRNLVHHTLIPGLADGAMVTYYNKNSPDWRLSLISKNAYWDDEGKLVKNETHPKRYTFVLGKNESVKTALQRIEPLIVAAQHSKGLKIDDILRAFSVQKISKEFFAVYKQNYLAFAEFLGTRTNMRALFTPDREDLTEDEQEKETKRNISNFSKKLLGRVIFLYFLQKKGWLGVPKDKSWGNGERDFVSQLFNNTKDKKTFYEQTLVPLFFETLNKKRAGDIFELTGTKVPFLNGGLFDRVNNEPVEIVFESQLFENLFAFFDNYNFTIDENSPDDLDIGIDPEMLGLIFENLLEENRNKTGAFYTPKEVVHFMCKESLSLYLQKQLAAKLNAEELKQLDGFIKQTDTSTPGFVKTHADDIQLHLDKVKICDPAIGSGAFPIGILFEILRIRKEIFPHLSKKKNFNYRDEKLNIMRKNIYGVDIDGGAVDIARLRFWLSLIVDEEEPSPLPNLDYKIMQGNSMMESFETDSFEDIDLSKVKIQAKEVKVYEPERDLFGNIKNAQLSFNSIPFDTEALEEKVSSFFKIEDSDEKRAKHQEIDDEVIKHIEISINSYEQGLLQDRETFVKQLNKDLLGATTAAMKDRVNSGPKAKIIATYDKKLADVDRIRKKLIKITEQAERPYFLWHLFFKEVFDTGGFDIVIGNPPYGVTFTERLKNKFELGSKDSYGIFMAHALKQLLKNNGTCAFIVSDTWLTIKSHFQLRELVLQNQLHKIIRLPADTFGATVNTCIYIQSKTLANSEMQLIAADLTNLSPQKRLPEFRDILFNLEKYVSTYSIDFAVYQYTQQLISVNTNLPVFIASPKLFTLMNDANSPKYKEIDYGPDIRLIQLNGKQIKTVRFGDIAACPHGISTGENKKYVRVSKGLKGSYPEIEGWMLCNPNEILKISDKEKTKGLNKDWKKLDGCFVPFEKGGESDSKDGWLPNYYVPTEYYINWGKGAILDMRKKAGFSWKNEKYFFKEGLTFSISGIYAPTFRLNSGGVFEAKGSGIFSDFYSKEFILGLLASKLARYVFKTSIKHTVDTSGDDIAAFPFLFLDENNATISKIEKLVNDIIYRQKTTPRYDYQSNEQIEIDALVYEAYGLNKADINEVETWYARRYPKMAKYADIVPLDDELEKIEEAIAAESINAQRVRSLIQLGENKRTEYKSTLRYCLKQNSPQLYIEHSVLKTIAAFLNSDGGALLVGVDDDGNILGLDNDYSTFGKNKNFQDEWVKHFDNITAHAFGNALMSNIKLEFAIVEEKAVAIIDVTASATRVFMKNKADGNRKQFYIRRNGSTVEIDAEEILEYVKQKWG